MKGSWFLRQWTIALLFLFSSSSPTVADTFTPPKPPLSTSWSNPVLVPNGYLLTHGAMDSSGSQLVTVDWNTGADNSRNLVVTTFTGAHQVVAGNAIYSSSFFQDPPRDTFPVLSGNGGRIAYLGYQAEGDTSAIYLIDKTGPGESWGGPYLLPAGFFGIDNELDLSHDGNTITFSNAPSLFGTMRIYVSRWEGGNWQPPVIVSGTGQGAQSSISADGRKIVYQNYDHIFYTELLPDGTWSAPLNLTHCYFSGYDYYMYLPRISPDGNAVFFWRYHLSGSTVTGKDLFALRRIGGSWSRPVLISGPTMVPTLDNESRAAVNQTGTRVVFNRPIQEPYSGTRLEMTELINGAWTAPVALTGEYRADFPALTADGLKTSFYQATYAGAGLAYITFNDAPPPFNYTVAGPTTIAATGGTLTSPTDQTVTGFANGTFSRNTQATHTVNPYGLLLPPTGILASRGSGFDLSAVAASDGMPIPADPANPFSIQVTYTDQAGPTLAPTLKLYNWRPEACLWVEVAGTLDVANKTIHTAAADRLGLFAVLGGTNHTYLPLVLK